MFSFPESTRKTGTTILIVQVLRSIWILCISHTYMVWWALKRKLPYSRPYILFHHQSLYNTRPIVARMFSSWMHLPLETWELSMWFGPVLPSLSDTLWDSSQNSIESRVHTFRSPESFDLVNDASERRWRQLVVIPSHGDWAMGKYLKGRLLARSLCNECMVIHLAAWVSQWVFCEQ